MCCRALLGFFSTVCDVHHAPDDDVDAGRDPQANRHPVRVQAAQRRPQADDPNHHLAVPVGDPLGIPQRVQEHRDADNLVPATINGHTGRDLNAAAPASGTDLFAYSLTTPSGYTTQAANGTNATVTLRDPNLPSLTANGASQISPLHSVSA